MTELSWKEKRILSPAEYEEKDKILFHHAVMCHVGLPRKFTEERLFERYSGNACLVLEAGRLWKQGKMIEQPLPYGARPRLIMIYLSTKFIQTRSRVIDIGKSLRSFLISVGIDPNGKNYHMVKRQLGALVACRMQLGMTREGYDITINTNPIKRFEAWSHPTKEQGILWPGELELSEDFAETLMEHAVPLANEAIGKLKDSALELDILSWLAHRLYRIEKPSGILISWENLKEQFGQEYGRMSNFKKQFIISLRYAISAYSDAKLAEKDNGIMLYPSRPLVAKKRG